MRETENRLYSFFIKTDDRKFYGQVSANDWNEAASLVEKSGGVVDGEVIESRCGSCLAVVEGTLPATLADFPEMIDG